MFEYTRFQYCPRCAAPALTPHEGKALLCQACGFTYYHGTAAAVVGIIAQDGKVLLSRRGCDPQKGWLDVPGGFVDYRETLEEALRRELREELNLEMTQAAYLCSQWGEYPFKGVMYFTAVAYFLVQVADLSQARAGDDVSAFELVDLASFDPRRLAFEPDRLALERYVQSL